MASLGHVAVGMAAGRWWARGRPAGPMLALSALSLAPDLDVIGMAHGVPYGAPWGHRGATHSIPMACLLGVAFAVLARGRGRFAVTALLATGVAISHGILDGMTDGGRGVAFLWPLAARRYFLPWRPIPVAPIGAGFLSLEGLEVAGWELAVFLPFLAYALWPRSKS
jgi:inner membrane protein